MNETMAAQVARAMYGPPPKRTGLLCDESVLRESRGHYEPCGRPAVSIVIAGDVVTDADLADARRYSYCKLHTTVALRSSWYRLDRAVTPGDHDRIDDERLVAWVDRGQRVIDVLADAGLDVLGRTCVFCSGPDRAGPCFGGDRCMA